MIVPLLVSAIRVKNQEELSPVSSEKDQAMIKATENNDSDLRREIKSILNGDQGFGVRKLQANKIIDHRKKRGSKIHQRIGTVDSNDSPLKTEVLAHKLAKEALKSPKMQETMKKLSHIPKPRKEVAISSPVKAPGRRNSMNKSTTEEKHLRPTKYRRRRKKKKKRHHKHFGERNSNRLPKRGPSKKATDIRRDTSMIVESDSKTENSSCTDNPAIVKDTIQNKSPEKSNVRINVVESEENEYVDFSSTPNTESSTMAAQKELVKRKEESMIERLMRTTSKDPTKKNPGDQGIEYSDYYNNDDDVVANKVEKKIVEPRNPNDRVIRQTLNSLSSNSENQIAGNVQPGLQNIEKYNDNPEKSLDDIQNYPGNDGSLELDENSGYPPMDTINRVNYGSVLNEDENFDGIHTNTEELPILDQPEMIDVTLSPQNGLDLDSNVDKEVQKSIELPEYNRLNYLKQYEQPNLRNFGINEGQSSDYNSDEVQIGKSVDDVSGRYNKFDSITQLQDENSASNLANNEETHYNNKENFNNRRHPGVGEFQTSDNYNVPQSYDRSLDYNRNIMSLPRTGNSRLSKIVEEDESQQPLYSGKQDLSQFYNNPYENNEEQNLRSFSLQPVDALNYDPNDSPSLTLPNAMEQPLGKVLETLGINVNGSARKTNRNTNSALRKNTEDNFVADNRERAGRPVYSVPRNLQRPINRWKVKEDLRNNYGQSHLRPSDFRTAKLGNGNVNVDEYSRRQVALSGTRVRNNLQDFAGENGHSAGATRSTNISEAVNETKQVANLLLDTIIDELEDLKRDRSKNNKREGLPCQLSGSWLTTQARMKLNMKVMNHAIIVTLSDLSSPSFRESPLNGTWNITGHVPFKHGGPFTLIASDNHTNSVAVFVGACRVCQGIDTIAGVWTISRQPKDCRDFQISTSVFNDVFRKTRLSTMKEKRHSTISSNPFAQNVTNLITFESTTRKKRGQ